jgi:hypothetical protein
VLPCLVDRHSGVVYAIHYVSIPEPSTARFCRAVSYK